MAKKRYIPMIETHEGNRREQWAEGKDGHSLSSSGRWTDAKMYSSKKEAQEIAERLARGFRKDENAESFVRTVEFETEKTCKKSTVEKTPKQEKKIRPNPFAKVDDVYLTKNTIAVTKTKKSKAKRGYSKTTQTKYYKQNSSNLKQLKAAQGDTVRVGRTGTNYRGI